MLEPPTNLVPLHLPTGQPTRSPGTPVGELLARRPLESVQSDSRPKPSKRPTLPIDLFCSESDSDATEIELSPSPATTLDKPDKKPKPSAAPHLRLPAEALQPTDESPSLSREEFGQQIDFSFCKPMVQISASHPGFSNQSLGPPTRACAKLLVRSGLRCSLCFRLKSECLYLHADTRR